MSHHVRMAAVTITVVLVLMASGEVLAAVGAGLTRLPAPEGRPAPAAGPSPGTTSPSATPSPSASPSATPSASPSPSPPPPPPDKPKPGCLTYTDTTGDAAAGLLPTDTSDLDVKGVAINTTGTQLRSYIEVVKLNPSNASGTVGGIADGVYGDRFTTGFTIAGKQVALVADRAADFPEVTTHVTATVAGVDESGLVQPTVSYDIVDNQVVLSADLAGLTQAVAKSTPLGIPLSDLSATSAALDPTGAPAGGDAASTTTRYPLGTSPCFVHHPATLTNDGDTRAEYRDTTDLIAQLLSSDGMPLAGRTVRFALGAGVLKAVTDAHGVAEAHLIETATAGTRTLVESFAGDGVATATTLRTPFTISVKATMIRLTVSKSGNRRAITATLRGDDNHPIVGQPITWYANGHLVARTKTNARGQTTYVTTTGRTIKAVFGGASREYLGSSALART